MRRRAWLFALASSVAAGALACQTPAAAPQVPPIGHTRRFAPIVPDALDHAAADLAGAALTGDPQRVVGALGALELALAQAGMPHARGGVEAAMDALRAPTAARIAAVAA